MSGSLLVALAIVVLAGLAAVLAAFPPGQLGLPARLALVFAFGYGITAGTAFLPTVARFLSPLSFFVALGVVTAGFFVLAFLRGGPREHARAIAAEVRADPWTLLTGFAVVAAIVVLRLGVSPLLNVEVAAPWRYWADGLEIADAGRIPELSLQYGTAFVPTVSKALFNSFNAGASFGLGSEPFPAVAGLVGVTAIGLVFGLWALGRELGLRFTAPLLPLLLVANRLLLDEELTRDLDAYKAENVGRMLAVAAAVLGVMAIRERLGWKEPALAGALLGFAAGTHLVPVAVVLGLLGFYGLARVVLDRRLAKIAAAGATIVIVAGGIAVIVGLAAGGDIGFQGATDPRRYQALGSELDATEYLATGNLEQEPREGPWFEEPAELYEQFVRRSTGVRKPGTPLRAAVAIGGLGAAVVMLLVFPRRLRPVGLVAFGLGGVLLGVTLLFSYRYDTFIPATFGERRMFDYGPVPVVLVSLGVVEAVVLLVGRLHRWAAVGLSAVLLVAAAVVVLPSSRPAAGAVALADRALAPAEWVRSHTGCNARILPNRRTAGVYQALTGRVSVIEGMSPFLRPPVLQAVVQELLRARQFFEDPLEHPGFLELRGVDFVIVSTGPGIGNAELLGETDLGALREAEFLRRVGARRDLEVFKVIRLRSVQQPADASEFPGYECRRGPIPTG